MNVILRKEDGSTSVLLFIYNMIQAKADAGSLYLSSLLEIMRTFEKAESATRMSLSRACKAGILESSKQGKDVIYSITPQAKEYIQNWNTVAAGFWNRLNMRQQAWDGKWHTVILTLADTGQKSDAVDRIKDLGYSQIGGTQFLGPWNRLQEVIGSLRQADIPASFISVHGELNTDCGVGTFIESTYKLPELRQAYNKFLNKYKGTLEQVQVESLGDAFISQGKALPVLHCLGWEFFRIASHDTMLPKALIPDWEGERAALLMHDLRKILEDSAWSFLEKYIQKGCQS